MDEEYRKDVKNIGTNEYKGIAAFWNLEYKHIMRPHTNKYKEVHDALLKKGLAVGGRSPEHFDCMVKIIYRQETKAARVHVETLKIRPRYDLVYGAGNPEAISTENRELMEEYLQERPALTELIRHWQEKELEDVLRSLEESKK